MVADNKADLCHPGLQEAKSMQPMCLVLDHTGHIKRLAESLFNMQVASISLVQRLVSRVDDPWLPDSEEFRTA